MEFLVGSALAEEVSAVVEEKEPFFEWIANPFAKLAKAGVWEWLSLAALVVLAVVLLVLSRKKVKWTTKMLAHAAMSLALSFVLSYIRFFRMAGGGSVTPGSMLPVMLFGASYGLVPGLLVALPIACSRSCRALKPRASWGCCWITFWPSPRWVWRVWRSICPSSGACTSPW